jgi:hypothetical protein
VKLGRAVFMLTRKIIGCPQAEHQDGSQKPEVYPWNVEGRSVALTYWGGPGIGSNRWQDANVVAFLCPRGPPTDAPQRASLG